MDRTIVYPGAIPLETDILSSQKNAMIGIAKVAAAMLGTGTLLNGLACTPNSPAAMNVLIAPGEIFSLQNIDGTAYGSLALDTTHNILKCGMSLDTVTLSTPAPVTSGYSVNYLVQIAFSETDSVPAVLPYYNASNPAIAYSGPSNSGSAQNTVRKDLCTIALKTGVAATTGTQTTPAPDSGFIGAWVVTVANGAATVTSGNISKYNGAPFIPYTLPQLTPANAVVGEHRNLAMTVNSASASATLTANEVIVEAALGGISYKIGSFSASINIGTTGAGGMDTGSAPTSGFVGIYAIYNPTSGAYALLGVNASSAKPFIYGGANMPAGYTASALLSVWPTNSSGQFVVGAQLGRQVSIVPITIASALGVQGSYTSISIASAAPANAKSISGLLQATNATDSGTGNINVYISPNTAGVGEISLGLLKATSVYYANSSPYVLPVLGAAIYYKLISAGLASSTTTITVSGYSI